VFFLLFSFFFVVLLATFGQCGFFCLRPSSTMFLKLLRLAQFELDYSPGLGDQFFYQKVFGDLTWQIPPIPGYNTVGFPATKDWTFFHNDTYIPVKHLQIKREGNIIVLLLVLLLLSVKSLTPILYFLLRKRLYCRERSYVSFQWNQEKALVKNTTKGSEDQL
jgi:hypothetical protein